MGTLSSARLLFIVTGIVLFLTCVGLVATQEIQPCDNVSVDSSADYIYDAQYC
jgi:hypothetical protein